jgi:hypothetical protein
MYIHGQATTELSRCVSLAGPSQAVERNWLSECHGSDFDSQAIFGGFGDGPYRIFDNRVEGAGENIMFGGVPNPGVVGRVPSDIEIRGNYLYTPPSWKGVWEKKNLLELKNSQRVLIEGNVMDGSWRDGQSGWAVIVRDDGCSWCRSTDVTIRRNLIRNAGAGINIADPLSRGTARVHVSENVLDSIGYQPGDRRGFQVLSGVDGVTLERNVLAGSLAAALWIEGGAPLALTDNVWASGQYGVMGSGVAGGAASLDRYAPGWVWSGMWLVSNPRTGYPTGTTWAPAESNAPLAQVIRAIVQQATAGVVIP